MITTTFCVFCLFFSVCQNGQGCQLSLGDIGDEGAMGEERNLQEWCGLKERTGFRNCSTVPKIFLEHVRHQNLFVFSNYCLSTHRERLENFSHQWFKSKGRDRISKSRAGICQPKWLAGHRWKRDKLKASEHGSGDGWRAIVTHKTERSKGFVRMEEHKMKTNE